MMTTSVTTTPIEATHSGIVYPGELVRTPTWQAALGQPLTGGIYFRVVFLETPSEVFPTSLQDHRIAVFVPGRRSRELQQAEIELRALREATATYAVGLPQLGQQDAEDRALTAWIALFREGQLISAPPLHTDLSSIFAYGNWSQWAERTGELLLTRAYPNVPINQQLLRGPLEPDSDLPALFDAFFDPSGPAATFALDTFGPALGVSSAVAPRVPGVQRRDWLTRLEAMVADGWAADAIGQSLAHEQGLTYPLADLFVLLWASQANHSIALKPGHGLLQRDGSVLDANRVDARNVADLRWPMRLWERIQALGPDTEEASSVDPFIAAIAGTPSGDVAGEADSQLSDLRQRLPAITAALATLAERIGASGPPPELAMLATLGEATSPGEAVVLGKANAGLREFDNGIRLWRAWTTSIHHVPTLIDALRWLNDAAITDLAGDVATEREALLIRISAPSLLSSPHGWAAAVDSVAVFKRRYADRYLRQHTAFHSEMSHLAHIVEGVARKANALVLLNQVTELGPAVGVGLDSLAEEARNSTTACGVQSTADSLAENPRCPACGMHLGAAPPTDDIAQLAEYVDDALATQNRRLAQHVAHQLVDRPNVEDLDTFIHIVQASDLTGLANVLDGKVVDFIRTLVSNQDVTNDG
ncbi:MAG: hypothetical protein O3B65_02125 [Chloroflexi bacterium]|nr:hypothetical protein [Chloroflexota bacterium]